MPPKKKKSGKKKGKKSGKKSARSGPLTGNSSVNELSKEFYLLQIRDLENRLARYNKKCEDLEVSNSKYTKDFQKQGNEKKDVIDFLKRSLEQKSDEIADLNDRLIGLQQLKDKKKDDYEKQLQELKTKYQETKDQLTLENMNLGSKVTSLEEFKVQKEDLLAKYAGMEADLERLKQEHVDMIENLDKKAVIDKDRLKKEMVVRVNQVAAEFRKVSNKQMAETTKRTLRENVSINAQLAKMADKTLELVAENDDIKQKERKQKQQIDMLEMNEKELAKKNLSNLKVIRMLTEKCKTQEAMLAESEANEEMYMDIKAETELMSEQLDSSRDELEVLAKEHEHLSNSIHDYKKQLKTSSKTMKKLERTLGESATQLKLSLTTAPQAWGEKDKMSAAAEKAKQENILEHLLAVISAATSKDGESEPIDFGRQEKMERVRSASEIPGSRQGFRKGDSLPLSPIPGAKPNLAHYQLGDLGLIPRPEDAIPTSVEKMKDLSASARLGGIKKVLTRTVGIQTVSAPKAMFFADQLLSSKSPEVKSAMLKDLKTGKSNTGKFTSLPAPKKITAKIF